MLRDDHQGDEPRHNSQRCGSVKNHRPCQRRGKGGWQFDPETEESYQCKPVLEGIRPEADINTGTSKQGANGIGNGEVCTFNRTILMGSVGTGRMEGIAELREERANLGVHLDPDRGPIY